MSLVNRQNGNMKASIRQAVNRHAHLFEITQVPYLNASACKILDDLKFQI